MSRALDRLRSETLHLVAQGTPPADILRLLCTELERMLSGTIVGVTMLDRSLQVFENAVFPSLSDLYADALKGIEVADRPGSCALAVAEGETVLCEDIASDPRFTDEWKALGLAHGMRAVISIPAMQGDGLALGTLVVAYPLGAPLNDADRKLADEAAALCGSVLAYRRTQLRQELLVGELQHRVRNLFSTIGAMVYSTLRSHPEPESFRKTFDGRLTALAKAHSLALEPGEADLRQLLVDTLAPYAVDHQVSIDGPRLMLARDAAVALSLAAHELATNAAKYGALSRPGGSVRIRWDLAEAEGASRFALSWVEAGGPVVPAPTRVGYGQKTISRSVASAFDGKVDIDYEPTGLRCQLSAPFSPRLGARLN